MSCASQRTLSLRVKAAGLREWSAPSGWVTMTTQGSAAYEAARGCVGLLHRPRHGSEHLEDLWMLLEHPSQARAFEASIEAFGEQLVQLGESEGGVRVFEQNALGALDDGIHCSSYVGGCSRGSKALAREGASPWVGRPHFGTSTELLGRFRICAWPVAATRC
jgi:hypothetical protein